MAVRLSCQENVFRPVCFVKRQSGSREGGWIAEIYYKNAKIYHYHHLSSDKVTPLEILWPSLTFQRRPVSPVDRI